MAHRHGHEHLFPGGIAAHCTVHSRARGEAAVRCGCVCQTTRDAYFGRCWPRNASARRYPGRKGQSWGHEGAAAEIQIAIGVVTESSSLQSALSPPIDD